MSIVAPEETAAAVTEEEKALPEWSEKVSSGILTGEGKLRLPPKPRKAFLRED